MDVTGFINRPSTLATPRLRKWHGAVELELPAGTVAAWNDVVVGPSKE